MHGNRLLNREWETGCMEEEGFCGGGEAGAHRENTLIQLLRRKETRFRRISQVLAVALVVLILGTVSLLVLVLRGERGPPLPDKQLMTQPDGHPPGVRFEQQQQEVLKHPSAMLTAPKGNNVNGKYLEWDSVIGHAFCQGDVSYSNGNLVVPRKGNYRVFVQITYESNGNIMCNNELRLMHKVFLFQDNYPDDVALLSSVDSVSCSMKQWSKSLYTAGIFSLQANSTLRVMSTQPQLIVKNEDQVFFGAELLP